MEPVVVSIAHPSLQLLVEPFVELVRAESRRFDRASAANPKPFPSLVRKVTDPQRHRWGVVGDGGELIGMASLSTDGEVAIAIAEHRRGDGLGTVLLAHLVERAERWGFERLVMEASRRSRPVAALGERFGWSSIEVGRGRVELLLDLPRRRAS